MYLPSLKFTIKMHVYGKGINCYLNLLAFKTTKCKSDPKQNIWFKLCGKCCGKKAVNNSNLKKIP